LTSVNAVVTSRAQRRITGEEMKRRVRFTFAFAIVSAAALAAPSSVAAADAAAAQALARQSNCFKCHAVDKNKEAPSWTELATKLKGDKDAQGKIVKHLTTGPKVKFLDGHEEEHPIIKTKDQDQIKNLADWILSLAK
jgi:cytochrome c